MEVKHEGISRDDETDCSNTVNSPVNEHVFLASVSTRETFLNWLSDGNAEKYLIRKKYSSDSILSCLDKISEYSVQKEISNVSFWEHTQFNKFRIVYNKLLRAKLYRVVDRNTYKIFIVAGKLYLEFLKENSHLFKSLAMESIAETKADETTTSVEPSIRSSNGPEGIVCLVAQSNTLPYVSNVQLPKGTVSEISEMGNQSSIEVGSNENDRLAQSKIDLIDLIIGVLAKEYPNGFRFDTTTIRLLSDRLALEIGFETLTELKSQMFRRNDDVFFLLDIVADAEARTRIIEIADNWLSEYDCFELSELYALCKKDLNERCIDSLENFETFYDFINKRAVRYVNPYDIRVVRTQRNGIQNIFRDVAVYLFNIIHNDFGGTASEDDVKANLPAFSTRLIEQIIKEYAEELVKTEINGVFCYQALDTIGLSDEFSIVLSEVLSTMDDIGLTPSEEVLHTALSLKMNINFKTEYNIPNDKTYRRLIALYYQGTPRREWKRGIFAEVGD